MEQKIKIGDIDLANLTDEKEVALFEALKKRITEREEGGSEFVIVRASSAGVFFGIPKQIANGMVMLDKCRRFWYWNGAASLSQLAKDGTDKTDCKFSVRTDSHVVMGVVEIIPCTKTAEKKLNAQKEWTA